MKSSLQWWNETKTNDMKLHTWLQRQCYGEFEAYKRITELANKFNSPILKTIADQEHAHYMWIRRYLQSLNIKFLTEHDERYWKNVDMNFHTLEQAAAVGHHAEVMRLERIKIIAQDQDFPNLASIFRKIQKDEEFHCEAFKSLTNEQELAIAAIDHEVAMTSLGLIA